MLAQYFSVLFSLVYCLIISAYKAMLWAIHHLKSSTAVLLYLFQLLFLQRYERNEKSFKQTQGDYAFTTEKSR